MSKGTFKVIFDKLGIGDIYAQTWGIVLIVGKCI